MVLTIGPTVATEPVSGSLLLGGSLSLGLGGDTNYTAILMRAEGVYSVTGAVGPSATAALMVRWDVGRTSRRIGLATGLAAGYPSAGWRLELMVGLTEAVAFTASITPGFRFDNDDHVAFALPITVGLDFGNF